MMDRSEQCGFDKLPVELLEAIADYVSIPRTSNAVTALAVSI